jgi:hypothetical protein
MAYVLDRLVSPGELKCCVIRNTERCTKQVKNFIALWLVICN